MHWAVLEVGANVADFAGDCYALSNSVTVIRNARPEGGQLTGGPFEFCVGDGSPDMVSGVELSGATGANSQYVITDDANIFWDYPDHQKTSILTKQGRAHA